MIDPTVITQKRKEMKLSQTELAEKVATLSGEKFSQQAVQKIESGATRVSGYLPYICVALGLDMRDVDKNLSKALAKRAADDLLQGLERLSKEKQAEFLQEAIKLIAKT